ncbi:hypothetical protein I79_007608 [Cricetulus griseus]|uniref:Uncharacterized protein n=1 Tax=Cricetulus griseus TaxID=10029 RepID=G3HAZ6_CRIGR|nr:hypothetical protein I79_007608 [Cricetulus griseus]
MERACNEKNVASSLWGAGKVGPSRPSSAHSSGQLWRLQFPVRCGVGEWEDVGSVVKLHKRVC